MAVGLESNKSLLKRDFNVAGGPETAMLLAETALT